MAALARPRLTAVCRNLLHNCGYNPTVIAWVEEELGCFKITSTAEFAETWGRMKSNRSASIYNTGCPILLGPLCFLLFCRLLLYRNTKTW